jgi:hypothetical protein
MFHPTRGSPAISIKCSMAIAAPGNCMWSQEFYETDRARGLARRYTLEFSRCQGTVGRGQWHADRPPALGLEHHGAYRRLSCHRTGMVAICEDLPKEHNTVTLVPC